MKGKERENSEMSGKKSRQRQLANNGSLIATGWLCCR